MENENTEEKVIKETPLRSKIRLAKINCFVRDLGEMASKYRAAYFELLEKLPYWRQETILDKNTDPNDRQVGEFVLEVSRVAEGYYEPEAPKDDTKWVDPPIQGDLTKN
tara:strand:- start:863 stop:1189 length:327 start_codon:yes stop_codon:yes gene_type:complete